MSDAGLHRALPPARGFASFLAGKKIEALPIIVVFIALIAVFTGFAPRVFLRWPIYDSFLVTIPPLLIISLGLTLVIAAAEIDLSFPAVIQFSGFLFAFCTLQLGLPWVGLIAALAGGALVGYVNGILVAYVGVPSIIITIGTSFFWSGVATVLSSGHSYALQELQNTAIANIFAGKLFGVPAEAFWALGVAVLGWFVLNRHRFGEHILFIGDSPSVAEVLGINVARERVRLFIMMGVLTGFAAFLLTVQNLNYFSTQGQGMLLDALAGVFIGGSSVFGGSATIVGSVFGALIIGMLEAGIVATGVAGFWVEVIVGLVFVIAVVLHIGIENPARVAAFRRRLTTRIVRAGDATKEEKS